MRYKNTVREQVCNLRKKGLSLGQIHKETQVPKTTIRLWIKKIELSQFQKENLKQHTLTALQKGRIRSQHKKVTERKKRENEIYITAKNKIKKISKQELFVAGIALYWGEGFKNQHEHRLGFCNSDPLMILFYVKWLREIFHIKKTDLVCRLTLNESYRGKTAEIQQYWMELLQISSVQFTKPFYQHTLWQKQYKTDTYYGVLRIHVKESKDLLWMMKGWIDGLKNAKIDDAYLPG